MFEPPFPRLTEDQVAFPPVEVWSNRYAHRDYEIVIDIPEFTSICPMTGLPDFGTVTIRYVPDQGCLELKALKYYMLAYRNLGIFYENAMNRILDDLVNAAQPRWMQVRGDFLPRGGIRTAAVITYSKPGFVWPKTTPSAG